MRLLPEAAEQGHLQGAERQTLLPPVLRQAVWINQTTCERAVCACAGVFLYVWE